MRELSLSNLWYWMLLIAVVCYFVGCFNFAVLISHFKHKDVRKMGSGNPGTMNMSREFGFKIGMLTLFSDAFKGGVPVLICHLIFRNFVFAGTDILVSDFMRWFAAVFVVVGHIYPVTMGFKGGKGIASTVGAIWFSIGCEAWWAFFVFFIVFASGIFAYIYFTEWGSMGSLIAVSGGSVVQLIVFYFTYGTAITHPWYLATVAMILALNLLTWFAHRANILRLLSGEEHHTSLKKMLHKKKAG